MITTAAACLALTLYMEARDQPIDVQLAVAEVVLNRVADPHFPDDVCAVIKQPHQFSYVLDGRSNVPKEGRAWRLSQMVADAVLIDPEGVLPQTGALFYHANYVRPAWADEFTLVAVIGDHLFYRRDAK